MAEITKTDGIRINAVPENSTMNKAQMEVLSRLINEYKKLRENGNVQEVTFLTADQKYSIVENPKITNYLLETLIIVLERELDITRREQPAEQLKNSREYKAAMVLEDALNNICFCPERFAQSIPYMHRTLQQNFFRMVREAVSYMADREAWQIDDRNLASYEMCKALKPMLKCVALPHI